IGPQADPSDYYYMGPISHYRLLTNLDEDSSHFLRNDVLADAKEALCDMVTPQGRLFVYAVIASVSGPEKPPIQFLSSTGDTVSFLGPGWHPTVQQFPRVLTESQMWEKVPFERWVVTKELPVLQTNSHRL